MRALDAARAGVFVHGDAGDRAAASLGERSVIASDVVNHIPASLEYLVRRGW
jgi:NAD(P)H-hydrate repair Nnr-like enzyme with NAD(P)H-hydrate dehydratase domain